MFVSGSLISIITNCWYEQSVILKLDVISYIWVYDIDIYNISYIYIIYGYIDKI